MTSSAALLKELKLLIAIQKKSITSNKASEKILLLAFNLHKPLFKPAELSEASQLFHNSLPFFFDTFHRLSIRIEPDTVSFAQRCCSGFQYLVDETSPVDNSELNTLLEGPVSVVKEYIKNCLENDIKPEYPSGSEKSEDLSKIPKSHWWWFVTPTSDTSDDE